MSHKNICKECGLIPVLEDDNFWAVTTTLMQRGWRLDSTGWYCPSCWANKAGKEDLDEDEEDPERA